MKVRAYSLSPFAARVIAVLCAAVFVAGTASTTLAAGVVGTGTAASCTDAALNAALDGGGLVMFNCGSAPVTIDISTGTGTKTIAADTAIDGGGLITVSGGNTVGVFSVDSGINFTVDNLTIANGRATGNGGGIANGGERVPLQGSSADGGTVIVTNSTFTDNSAVAYVDGGLGLGGDGGGIANGSGSLTVTNSTFTMNRALGGDIGSASGGGIANQGGTVAISNSTFIGNSAYNYGRDRQLRRQL